MADCPPYIGGCFHSLKLAGLALLLAAAIVLQILACALFDNWWPLLTVIMYILLPMPLLFFGSASAEVYSSTEPNDWADIAKFLTGFSAIGSIAIPSILYHAQLIEAGAMCMAFASFFVLMVTGILFARMLGRDDEW